MHELKDKIVCSQCEKANLISANEKMQGEKIQMMKQVAELEAEIGRLERINKKIRLT